MRITQHSPFHMPRAETALETSTREMMPTVLSLCLMWSYMSKPVQRRDLAKQTLRIL